MACGCQKNKANTVAANKVAQKPLRPNTSPTRPTSRLNSGRIEKRIIR